MRTTVVFADPSDAEKRVQTCLQHVKNDKGWPLFFLNIPAQRLCEGIIIFMLL